VPLAASGPTGVVALAAGGGNTLALRADGTVWAWGYNAFGDLGDGTPTSSSVPVQVSGLAGVTTIAGAWDGGLAAQSDGTAWDWGYNGYGELGNGTVSTTGCTWSDVPVPVSGLAGATDMAGG
jgi:alpha-tubulin suppressor-like RCC1 family protein